MTDARKAGSRELWYRAFKYAIYCLLAVNVWLFFLEDSGGSAQTFSNGISWRNLVEAYSATVDTFAWVILLLLFELETAVISDEKLKGSLKTVLMAVRGVCYFFICYSFYGYVVKYGLVTNLVPFQVNDVCSLIGTGYTYVDDLDDYFPLTPEVCAAMQNQPLQQIVGTQIIGTEERLALTQRLAITDIVNAGDWLIIVALLETEVWLQVRGLLSKGLLKATAIAKGVLYSVLLACAIYWGIDGEFLDFWDAFLWLVAFVFIEMNIFHWQEETAAERVPAQSPSVSKA